MLSRKHFAIRWRLTGWILLIVFVTIGLAGFVFLGLVQDRFIEEVDAEMTRSAEDVRTALDVFGEEFLTEVADAGIGTSEHALVLIGADGARWAYPSGSFDHPDPLPDLGEVTVSELRGRSGVPFTLPGGDGVPDYRVLTVQMAAGEVLVIGAPLDDLAEGIQNVRRSLVIVALVAGVLMVLVVSFVAGSVTRPLEGMVATAERIGSGALDQRVDVHGDDDVARLAAALNAMLDRLERAFADRQSSEDRLRQFLADASHELRTPITTVLGYTELIQSGMATSGEHVDRAVARIASEGERMRLLVEELLLLARLDEHRPADHVDVDVADLVEVAVADARAVAPDRRIAVRAADRPATVVGDPLTLRQAIDNLLTNARVHTPPGTVVEVAVEHRDATVTVTVDDDGPGIDPADTAHLFDRFFRSEGPRAGRSASGSHGAGLGLAIVAAVVDVHGGTVESTASPAGGARFVMTFPAASAGAEAGPQPGP